jgi:acetyltransferase-like isoleucine patch superfamily enzyme
MARPVARRRADNAPRRPLNPAVLRPLLSPFLRAWLRLQSPRMLYGVRSGCGAWRAHSRIGSHTQVLAPGRLLLGDHVFIGQFNLVDASGGMTIGTGCQVTSHVALLTHASHRAARLLRQGYWAHPGLAEAASPPPGFVREPTVLDEWCFVGPHSVVGPGARLGRGVLVRAFSLVRGEVPDFAIVQGQPARVVGDVREADRAWIAAHGAAAGFGAEDAAAYEAWAAGAPAR